MTWYLLGQILGFLFLGMFVLSFQFKDKKKLLISRILGGIFATLHYFLIGAITGAFSEIPSVVAGILAAKLKKKKDKIITAIFFAMVYLAIMIYGYQRLSDLLPPIACLLSVIVVLFGNTKHIRFSQFIISPMFLLYGCIHHSYAGIINEIFVLSSCIIGIIRLDRKD